MGSTESEPDPQTNKAQLITRAPFSLLFGFITLTNKKKGKRVLLGNLAIRGSCCGIREKAQTLNQANPLDPIRWPRRCPLFRRLVAAWQGLLGFIKVY